MAVYTYSNAYVSLGGTEISDHVTSLTMNQSIDALEKTAMGASTHTFRAGLENWTAEIEVLGDFAASELDAIFAAASNNELAVEFRSVNTTVATTNPKWTGTGLVTSYSPLMGAVGDQAKQTISLVANTALTRATS